MDPVELIYATVLATVVRNIPQEFWSELREGAKRTYADTFQQVRNEPNLLDIQRIDLLYQYRHCRMEHLLMTLAGKHEMSCSSTLLEKNGRFYVLVQQGGVALTQSYVPTIGAMPKPARYLERHAKINEITRSPQLGILGEPQQLFAKKDFYGLLAHNPVGRRFGEAEQNLGMIQLCVPVEDHSEWAAELTIQEILSAYESAKPVERPDRRLAWRREQQEGTGEE